MERVSVVDIASAFEARTVTGPNTSTTSTEPAPDRPISQVKKLFARAYDGIAPPSLSTCSTTRKPLSASFGACCSAPSYWSAPVLAAGLLQSLTDICSRTVFTPSVPSLGMASSTSTCGPTTMP